MDHGSKSCLLRFACQIYCQIFVRFQSNTISYNMISISSIADKINMHGHVQREHNVIG